MAELICPKCGSRFTYFSKLKNIYVCEECEHTFNMGWDQKCVRIEDLLSNEYWSKEFWEIAPIPLASSYHQLFGYISENNIGCILFGIRDVFELLIKVPVTILFNGIHRGQDSEFNRFQYIISVDDGIRKLYEYSFQMLVTGKWWECVRIGSRINDSSWYKLCENKEEAQLYIETVRYLGFLYTNMQYGPQKHRSSMVTWRNRVLGHSCLSDNVETKLKDIPFIMSMFKTVCEESIDYYEKVCFTNKKKEPLKGNSSSNADAEVYIRFQSSEERVENVYIYHPFLAGRISNLACFDGYEKGKGYLLGYDNACRYQSMTLSELLLRHQSSTSGGLCNIEANDVFADSIETKDINALEELLSQHHEIIGMGSLFEWLMDSVNSTDSGVLILESERGTGKSTFCSAIDGLNTDVSLILDQSILDKWNAFEEESVIRVWHFNPGYRERKDIFLQGIREALLTMDPAIQNDFSNQSANVLLGGRIMEAWNAFFTCDEDDNSIFFGECLNMTLNEYKKRKGVSRLILVLDGIDEVTDPSYLFSLFPRDGVLNKDIYFLLTCRTTEELKHKTDLIKLMDNCSFSRSLTFKRKNIDNDNMTQVEREYYSAIETYVRDMLIEQRKTADDSMIQKILASFEYRFSIISAYRRLCGINPIFVDSIDTNIFETFTKQLEKNAPRSYVRKAKDILSVLLYANDLLNLREMAYLSGEYSVTYRLLGILYDLRAFIINERGSKGNLYQISHTQWVDYAEKWIPEGRHSFINRCNSLINEMRCFYDDSNILTLTDEYHMGEFWIVRHGLEIYMSSSDIISISDNDFNIDAVIELLHRLFTNPEYPQIAFEEYSSSTDRKYWIFDIQRDYMQYIKESGYGKSTNKQKETDNQTLMLADDIINLYEAMICVFSDSINNQHTLEDRDSVETYNKRKAYLLFQIGTMYLEYDEISHGDYLSNVQNSINAAQALHHDMFELFDADIHLQKARYLFAKGEYLGACLECMIPVHEWFSENGTCSVDEKLIRIQAFMLYASSRSHFDKAFPFQEDNSLDYLHRAEGLIHELLNEKICKTYLDYERKIADMIMDCITQQRHFSDDNMMKETVASIMLDCDFWEDEMYYMAVLEELNDIFFDKSVIFKAEIVRLFVEKMHINVDENVAIVAGLLHDCKRKILSDGITIQNSSTYIEETDCYLKQLGFDERFRRICRQVHDYYDCEPRESESEIIEVIDCFGNLLLDKPDSPGISPEKAMDITIDVLKDTENHYLDRFEFFVRKMQKVYI